ncbi:MAG: amidohydrolase family protein, partial [Chthoniobacteraceae bacterium]
IYSEVFALPERASDAYDVHFSAPAVLHKAGVTVAISEGLERASASGQRNLPYIAAQAAAFGLPPDAALAAITLIPAQLHGVGDKLGSLEKGKMANVVVTDGDIFQLTTNIAGSETALDLRR